MKTVNSFFFPGNTGTIFYKYFSLTAYFPTKLVAMKMTKTHFKTTPDIEKIIEPKT